MKEKNDITYEQMVVDLQLYISKISNLEHQYSNIISDKSSEITTAQSEEIDLLQKQMEGLRMAADSLSKRIINIMNRGR